mmetsp:Transcript_31900/g.53609  ORF Transcript_31900/g.53609 Transcript_31900/m.53609 type:complete len:245 (+) Transcript_31900:802-1536(+)
MLVVEARRHQLQQRRRTQVALFTIGRGHRKGLAHCPHPLHHLPALEAPPGEVASDHLPQHHPKGVDVAPLCAPAVPAQDLRRHVGDGARPRGRGEGLHAAGPDSAQPKVRHLDAVVLVEQQVGRLEVAVHDALRVQVRAPLGDVTRHLQQAAPLGQLLLAVEQVVQTAPREVLRHQAQVRGPQARAHEEDNAVGAQPFQQRQLAGERLRQSLALLLLMCVIQIVVLLTAVADIVLLAAAHTNVI